MHTEGMVHHKMDNKIDTIEQYNITYKGDLIMQMNNIVSATVNRCYI